MRQNDNLEATIEEYAKSKELELAYALETLKTTPEWQMLIEQELFKEIPVRLIHLRKDSALTINPDPTAQLQLKSINNMLDCVGEFSSFLRGVETKGKEITAYINKLSEKSVKE